MFSCLPDTGKISPSQTRRILWGKIPKVILHAGLSYFSQDSISTLGDTTI